MVKLGVSLPQFQHYSPGKDVITAARAIEEIGFDSLRSSGPATTSGRPSSTATW